MQRSRKIAIIINRTGANKEMSKLTIDGILKIGLVSIIIAGVFAAPYWGKQEELGVKKCNDAGLTYYKPYKSGAICVGEVIKLETKEVK